MGFTAAGDSDDEATAALAAAVSMSPQSHCLTVTTGQTKKDVEPSDRPASSSSVFASVVVESPTGKSESPTG
jgi:hypothetical protein